MDIPAIIAVTNANTGASPEASATTDGPGQNPESPQPTPNSAAPPSKLASSSFLVGSSNSSSRTGRERLKITRNAGMATNSAPTMTTAKVGSQSPATSRKPMTFWGFTIPETVNPSPKSVPENKATSILSISASFRARDG